MPADKNTVAAVSVVEGYLKKCEDTAKKAATSGNVDAMRKAISCNSDLTALVRIAKRVKDGSYEFTATE